MKSKKVLAIAALATLSISTFAAKAPATKWQPDYWVPSLESVSNFTPKATTSKRKVASEQTFSESDLSADFKNLRAEWLKVTTADQMEALLKTSFAKYNSYSDDTKYFLSQAHLALPLRGIVWRLRPLFEKGTGFVGTKASHVGAVEILRKVAAVIDVALPTDQADASFRYFTEPSASMSQASQFKTIAEFQNFLTTEFGKKLIESTKNQEMLLSKNHENIFVWDNKMQFGTGAFRDDIQRYTGHGAAEMNLAIAANYKSMHEIFVFCAYNQDELLNISKKMAAHLGQDSVVVLGKEKEDLGLTDKERVAILNNSKNFLTIRDSGSNQYGSSLMKQAYKALVNYVSYTKEAYDLLQGKEANSSMGLNPIHFSAESQSHLGKGISNMLAVAKGPAEVRDPVSGKSVSLDLPAFYSHPPRDLKVLRANKFEEGESEKSIKAANGEVLKVRNYSKGRSIGWNNNVWKEFVPSAAGQSDNYMSEARRIMRYSLGTSLVMNLPAIFVK